MDGSCASYGLEPWMPQKVVPYRAERRPTGIRQMGSELNCHCHVASGVSLCPSQLPRHPVALNCSGAALLSALGEQASHL